MEKKKLKKLSLKKQTIASLEQDELLNIKGGTGTTCIGTCAPFTVGDCDFPTVGHDDGPYCVSESDAWCWCYGV